MLLKQKSSFFKKFLTFIYKFFICIFKVFEKIFIVIFLLIIAIWLAWWTSQQPSLYRDWEPQDAILPEISWSWNIVNIKNIRDHKWIDDKNFEANYLEKSYNIDEIEWLHYLITPFSDFVGPAHTMLSFSFSNGEKIVISAEIRKEYGENFDAIKWIMNQFEIQYVIATEDDVVKLRTNYRKNDVIMYPIDTPKEKIAHIFRSMLVRADKLTREPEFYNTIWNNCTTSILRHANAFREDKIGWSKYLILPAHSDEILFSENLVKTNLPIEEARKFYNISEKARNIAEWENFSEIIRKN